MITLDAEGRPALGALPDQTPDHSRADRARWAIYGLAAGAAAFAAAALLVTDNHAGADGASVQSPPGGGRAMVVATRTDAAAPARKTPVTNPEPARRERPAPTAAQAKTHTPSTAALRATGAQQVTNSLYAAL